MLTVKGLSKRFNKNYVVNDVSFTLKEGLCTALIGPNGAGKTTVLRMLTGLIKPNEGTISYGENGRDFRYMIGYLPQYPKFDEWMTGEEFLTYCCKLFGFSNCETKKRTAKLLKMVGLSHVYNKRIGTYSGGMKQRLGIAQALIHDPEILFLDEPVSSLDPIGRRDVLTLMKELKEKMTILFSTHILNDAEEISDSVIVLKDGKIIENGTMKELEKKYTTSKIMIQFTHNRFDAIKDIKSLSTVTSVERVGSYLHLYVTDVYLAQNELFQFILNNHLTLNEFRIERMSMEEMFMEAVN